MTLATSPRLLTREAYSGQDVPLQFDPRANLVPSSTTHPLSEVGSHRNWTPSIYASNAIRAAPIASSAVGMIHVYGYTPTEGERGVPITVRINFHHDSLSDVYVRLVVGHKAVATRVRELVDTTYGRWQLDAATPAFDKQSSSAKVLLTVQALNTEDSILDSVTFGEFAYWVSECSSPPPYMPPIRSLEHDTTQDVTPSSIPGIASSSTVSDGPSIRRRSSTQLPTPSPTFSDRVPASKTRQRKNQLQRRAKAQSLMRAKYSTSGELLEDVHAQTPILELVTPLEGLCCGWDASELAVGRRLVRFQKLQEGRRLIVSCEPIRQEDYCDTDTVISCIYREEAETCFVTSVDIIYLLERLTNDEFPVEEKNRIRRNLEGLRPTTVSKHKPGFEYFFQCIMEFPDPKPRNIEKDLKVFEWTLLGQALDKILSKYSIFTSSPVDSAGTTPLPIEPILAGSPQLRDMSLEYPRSTEQIQSGFVDPAAVTKSEGLPDGILFLPSERSEAFYATSVASVAATASSTVHSYTPTTSVYASDFSNTQDSESSSEDWISDSHIGDMGIHDFSIPNTFAPPIIHMEAYADDSGYSFSGYEPLEFRDMREDSLDHFL